MSIKRALFFVFGLLLFSCEDSVIICSETVDFSIKSPVSGWTYYEDSKIMLAVNVNTEDIIWESDISGYLGEGNHLTLFLPEGIQRVSAKIRGVVRERIVIVLPNHAAYNSRSVLVHYSPLEIKAGTGNIWPYTHTHDGTVSDLGISPLQGAENKSAFVPFYTTDVLHIRLPMPQTRKIAVNKSRRSRSTVAGYSVGERKNFFVANTLNQLGSPHDLEAELFYKSDALTVWVSVFHLSSGEFSAEMLNRFIEKAETLIVPRVQALWGKAADIDDDGRIALLFSHTLNEERLATGFFNPADFFEKNNDVQSEAYNPSSNEADLIYLALPDPSSGSSFSLESIIATAAHEMAHASTFTVKTWNRLKDGDASAAREELFLDEGWSHLTENLCGMGVSGGNIRFLKRFLDDTSAYSFCGANHMGQDDSTGMRGAVTLFLSRLFWDAGGMTWDTANTVNLIDLGGIAFLQRMAVSHKTGWDSIGEAFGRQTGALFDEMLEEINVYRMTDRVHDYRTDPLTNEAVDFFVNMGDLRNPDGTTSVHIGFPAELSIFEKNVLLPWSVVFYDMFSNPGGTPLMLHSALNKGEVFFSYSITENR